MTRAEILNCLTDRPCEVCKFHESGRCERWDCVFEEKPDDVERAKWIPVSEKLPGIHNYCMKYLVTDCYGHIHTSLFTESNGKSWWSHSDVIAWMPLPEPYKAESEDKE